MAPDEPLPAHRSRRAFLRTAGCGVAAGSGLLLSACGSEAPKKRLAGSEPRGVREADISIMNGVLDAEHTAIAAYTAGIPLLSAHARVAATTFLRHELEHAQKLQATIRAAGGKANLPRASYDLGNPRGEAQVLELLSSTESMLIGAYLDAIPRLMPGSLRGIAAGILANESQHISVLRAAQGKRPVPSAFVSTSE